MAEPSRPGTHRFFSAMARVGNSHLRIIFNNPELFPGETVEFPFSELDQKTHAELRKCFNTRGLGIRSRFNGAALSDLSERIVDSHTSASVRIQADNACESTTQTKPDGLRW